MSSSTDTTPQGDRSSSASPESPNRLRSHSSSPLSSSCRFSDSPSRAKLHTNTHDHQDQPGSSHIIMNSRGRSHSMQSTSSLGTASPTTISSRQFSKSPSSSADRSNNGTLRTRRGSSPYSVPSHDPQQRKKVVIVTGGTAVGKTAISLEIARQCNGEIVSADSMQVYQQFDIGTAKIGSDETENIPHHLIDVVPPGCTDFSVAMFFQAATNIIADITSRGKTPVLVGGTGLYLRWLLYGRPADMNITPDNQARGLTMSYFLNPLTKGLIAWEKEAGAGKGAPKTAGNTHILHLHEPINAIPTASNLLSSRLQELNTFYTDQKILFPQQPQLNDAIDDLLTTELQHIHLSNHVRWICVDDMIGTSSSNNDQNPQADIKHSAYDKVNIQSTSLHQEIPLQDVILPAFHLIPFLDTIQDFTERIHKISDAQLHEYSSTVENSQDFSTHRATLAVGTQGLESDKDEMDVEFTTYRNGFPIPSSPNALHNRAESMRIFYQTYIDVHREQYQQRLVQATLKLFPECSGGIPAISHQGKMYTPRLLLLDTMRKEPNNTTTREDSPFAEILQEYTQSLRTHLDDYYNVTDLAQVDRILNEHLSSPQQQQQQQQQQKQQGNQRQQKKGGDQKPLPSLLQHLDAQNEVIITKNLDPFQLTLFSEPSTDVSIDGILPSLYHGFEDPHYLDDNLQIPQKLQAIADHRIQPMSHPPRVVTNNVSIVLKEPHHQHLSASSPSSNGSQSIYHRIRPGIYKFNDGVFLEITKSAPSPVFRLPPITPIPSLSSLFFQSKLLATQWNLRVCAWADHNRNVNDIYRLEKALCHAISSQGASIPNRYRDQMSSSPLRVLAGYDDDPMAPDENDQHDMSHRILTQDDDDATLDHALQPEGLLHHYDVRCFFLTTQRNLHFRLADYRCEQMMKNGMLKESLFLINSYNKRDGLWPTSLNYDYFMRGDVESYFNNFFPPPTKQQQIEYAQRYRHPYLNDDHHGNTSSLHMETSPERKAISESNADIYDDSGPKMSSDWFHLEDMLHGHRQLALPILSKIYRHLFNLYNTSQSSHLQQPKQGLPLHPQLPYQNQYHLHSKLSLSSADVYCSNAISTMIVSLFERSLVWIGIAMKNPDTLFPSPESVHIQHRVENENNASQASTHTNTNDYFNNDDVKNDLKILVQRLPPEFHYMYSNMAVEDCGDSDREVYNAHAVNDLMTIRAKLATILVAAHMFEKQYAVMHKPHDIITPILDAVFPQYNWQDNYGLQYISSVLNIPLEHQKRHPISDYDYGVGGKDLARFTHPQHPQHGKYPSNQSDLPSSSPHPAICPVSHLVDLPLMDLIPHYHQSQAQSQQLHEQQQSQHTKPEVNPYGTINIVPKANTGLSLFSPRVKSIGYTNIIGFFTSSKVDTMFQQWKMIMTVLERKYLHEPSLIQQQSIAIKTMQPYRKYAKRDRENTPTIGLMADFTDRIAWNQDLALQNRLLNMEYPINRTFMKQLQQMKEQMTPNQTNHHTDSPDTIPIPMSTLREVFPLQTTVAFLKLLEEFQISTRTYIRRQFTLFSDEPSCQMVYVPVDNITPVMERPNATMFEEYNKIHADFMHTYHDHHYKHLAHHYERIMGSKWFNPDVLREMNSEGDPISEDSEDSDSMGSHSRKRSVSSASSYSSEASSTSSTSSSSSSSSVSSASSEGELSYRFPPGFTYPSEQAMQEFHQFQQDLRDFHRNLRSIMKHQHYVVREVKFTTNQLINYHILATGKHPLRKSLPVLYDFETSNTLSKYKESLGELIPLIIDEIKKPQHDYWRQMVHRHALKQQECSIPSSSSSSDDSENPADINPDSPLSKGLPTEDSADMIGYRSVNQIYWNDAAIANTLIEFCEYSRVMQTHPQFYSEIYHQKFGEHQSISTAPFPWDQFVSVNPQSLKRHMY